MKPKQSSRLKNAVFTTILFSISIISGLLLFIVFNSTIKTMVVPVSISPIKAGSMIKKEDISEIEISTHNIPSTVVRNADELVSRYATRDIGEGELFFTNSITDNYQRRLSEKAKYGAMSIPISGVDTITGDIKENDFIRILISIKKGEDGDYGESSDQLPKTNTALIYTPELAAVRVLGLYNAEGSVVNQSVGGTSSANQLVLDPLPAQRVLLGQARDNGSIRIVILPEYEQQAYRKQWGLADEVVKGKIQNDLYKGLKTAEQIEKSHMVLSEQEDLSKYLKQTEGRTDDKSSEENRSESKENKSESEENSEQDSGQEQQ